MTEKPPHPIVPFVTGVIMGAVLRDLSPAEATARLPGQFQIKLAAGRVLRVTVEEVADPEASRG